MESALSPDKEKDTPPVPIKTYQWEDLRRAREAGGYPWTHLLKPPIEGEITGEDIIRETTPRRSMSREISRSRTHTPVDSDAQRILILDNSPGSCRKHGDEGEDEGVQIPNFSKEISLDSEEEAINPAVNVYALKRPESQSSSHLVTPVEIPKNVSPKGILKRRVHEPQYIGVSETREKTKCCHPLVNKIKHLADKTLHKLDRNEMEKSPQLKRKKNEEIQEIRQLRSSPGAVRRQKFSVIKLGDSDEMSKTMGVDTPPPRKKKEHIYEDIEEAKANAHQHIENDANYNKTEEDESKSNSNKENESLLDKKSNASQDPSLITEEVAPLKPEEQIMEKLHQKDNVNKEAVLLDDELDMDEPNVDEIFQNQLDESRKNDSPNITITEIIDDDIEPNTEQSSAIPIETSPSPSPRVIEGQRNVEFMDKEWSRPSSDHEYEVIEKPLQNTPYTVPNAHEKPTSDKTDDDLSSTTSLERKYLQNNSDEDENVKENICELDNKNEAILTAQALQNDIEDRFFVNTPSTVSRTECEISTSQVDSSALENLPLKRENRTKNMESTDSKIKQRIKEGTGKLKTQAGKLKTKLNNIKPKQFSMAEKPKNNLPDRPKFKMPERPKISLPDRPKFTLPDKRKFSLPDRSKFKNINFTQKLSLGDRKKFKMPDRPKFNVPELPKFKIPDKAKINFPSIGKKKEVKTETNATDSNSEIQNVATIEFESKTYPRLFSRKKKSELPKTSSSPTLNRDDTPPPTFTFTRVKPKEKPNSYIPDSPEQPREYGNIDNEANSENGIEERKQFDIRYDFDKLQPEYMDDELEPNDLNNGNAVSISDMLPKQEYTHVINEINNDEFFVRPRGISRENIQVREYLSDEIRQAFKIPKNALALMSSDKADDNLGTMYGNHVEGDPDLMIDDNEQIRYSNEDINDKDDGYYTFPPVRPSRAKRKKKELESVQYIDDSVSASRQFSEVDLGLPEDNIEDPQYPDDFVDVDAVVPENHMDFTTTDLHSIHEYANDDIIEYPEAVPIESQTLPMPPKRKKKFGKKEFMHSSLNDFNSIPAAEMWNNHHHQPQDLIVYRTQHEYMMPQTQTTVTEQSPVPPRRNRSRSSRGTSFCDDDRTSHGAESLTLDTNVPPVDDTERDNRHESPGYATVDKGPYAHNKNIRRSYSKTPPVRRRKSNSSERKYYTVGSAKNLNPDRPPRKKSSTSLVTLDSLTKRSISADLTQYVEIDEPQFEEVHKDLKSGEIVSKMKDRPLPPPPRPPRGPKRKKSIKKINSEQSMTEPVLERDKLENYLQSQVNDDEVAEIEVSTQTDPLPDDVDFELDIDDNLGISMNSLRDLVDEDSSISKSFGKLTDNLRTSRPTSRNNMSLKLSDPKISELSKSNLGRTSPTVILVERRVSSPTRINEKEVMLTEASLTVQPIDIEESQIPDVPPLPRARTKSNAVVASKNEIPKEEQALERVGDSNKDVKLDNLVTQRLQVHDLDVGRLNVSELQASKILVSDIEGMTLQVTELDSKSGHLSVSGIEFSQSVIDEIVKKFAEISTNSVSTPKTSEIDNPRPVSREEHTQTDINTDQDQASQKVATEDQTQKLPSSPPPLPNNIDDTSTPPQRPPPPDLTPLLYTYLQDLTVPPGSFYPGRTQRDRPFADFLEPQQHQTPAPPTRRAKRKQVTPISESSSDDGRPRPSPRRMVPPVKTHEPSITEAGAQFLRVCQSSISRMFRSIFNSFISYISGTEDKKDVQMALVIFLVLIAGLIMFGLSDSRTIHHHHWEFFNPPDGKQ